jgi:hypothetical protein
MNKLLLKIVGNGIVVVGLLMLFTEGSFIGALAAAVALSIIAYLLGDQMVLRKTNNGVATVADAVLAAIYLWAVVDFANWSLSLGELLTIVIVLGAFEYFFHSLLLKDNHTGIRDDAKVTDK